MLSPGTDYSPWDQDQIIRYQFGKKTCYIPKVWKFYVEKGWLAYVRTHQQMTFITFNRFCQLSKTLPPPPVINGNNQAGWENTYPFYILFHVLKILIQIYKLQNPGLFFFVLRISFYISWYHFSQFFRTSFNIIRKNYFCQIFLF